MHPAPAAVPAALAALAAGLFAASPALAGADRVHASGALVGYTADVPPGVRGEVDVVYDAAGSTHVVLSVSGLVPGRRYAGRAHLGGCPNRATDLGAVFQQIPNPDPRHPDDPNFRNPGNEVWLDLRADEAGTARVRATLPWQFEPGRRPGSVVLHRSLVQNSPTEPAAGAAQGCIEVGF